MSEGSRIALSLISHTNAGKTTLARTLLGRDVGEVRDAPHVTAEATMFVLVDTADGDALVLWDTPGFGDSARLARRLQQQGNPIGWFLSQVWDRYRDQSFWLTQLAVHNVRAEADVVLYLVNAAEAPGDAGYLAPELAVLEWIGKPVIVLLNQTGRPRPRSDEAADEDRWREALGARPLVREVMALDAFARCWVQEFTLLAAVARVLPVPKQPAFARLMAAWRARRIAAFEAAMGVLAGPLARAACDRVTLPADRLLARLGKTLGIAPSNGERPEETAGREMAARLDADLLASTDRLIAIHGLEGQAVGDALERLARDIGVDAPLDEGKAAMMGGVVSGALTGLTVDLASGGMTFGAGMLAGAILGALGGAGVARGVNVVRGKTHATLRWEEAFLNDLVVSSLLRYLAVAHFGRGRGEWKESETPSHWRDSVTRVVGTRQAALTQVWSGRSADGAVDAIEARLREVLGALARALLDELYPGAIGNWTGADDQESLGPEDPPAGPRYANP